MRRTRLQKDTPSLNADSAVQDILYHPGQHLMLHLEDAGRELLHRIVIVYRDGCLRDDRALIYSFGDKVSCAPADLDTCSQRVGLRSWSHSTGESRQERWMDIDDAHRVSVDDTTIQN